MENLVFKGTSRTPSVKLDTENGVLDIEGYSIPDNSALFFAPLINDIDSYVKDASKKLVVNVKLDYLNSSSSKVFMEIFKKISTLDNAVFNWHYNSDDDEILDYAKNCEEVTNKPFNFYGYKDMD